MRYYFYFLIIFCLLGWKGLAQVGERVRDVKVLNAADDTVFLPGFGEKNLVIFYPDPTHARQNKNLQDYFRTHPFNSNLIESYGIVNLAAAPLIPNGLIKRKAEKAVKGTNARVYFDPDNALSRAWKLGDVNNASCIILVGKDRTIQFFKAGQVTKAEMQQVIDWVNGKKEDNQ